MNHSLKRKSKFSLKKQKNYQKALKWVKKELKINNTDKKVEIKNNRPTIPLQSALCIEIGGFI